MDGSLDATVQPAAAVQRPNMVRRLYDWCLSWADTPYGTPALALLSFTEASFFPIPPDVLQIALSVGKPKRSFYYALVSAIASVAGAVLGWVIGYYFWASTQDFFYNVIPGFTEAVFQKVEAGYQNNAFLFIVGAAFTIIPFKVFTVAAGACNVSLTTLVVASIIGRSARFFLVAALIYFFGPKVREWIDRYFNIATILLFVVFVVGILALKMLR